MELTKPRFLVANTDAPITVLKANIVSTQIEGEWYTFYKHEDGSTKLMKRSIYYEYLDCGLIPEPGKPEDIPGLTI
jgi:hypothetical protein